MNVHVEKDVYIPMRDGVGLATDLYYPAHLTSHAALLVVTPYSKDPQRPIVELDGLGRRIPFADGDAPSPELIDSVLPMVTPFVDAGFVVAVADARGTGYSEGIYDYYNLDSGPYDGYDLVEWLAAQPWCSGAVGMMGGSASAIYCYITALTAPPHLRAMTASVHPGDLYFDQWRIGGVFRWDGRINWAREIGATTQPVDPGDPAAPGHERKRAVYQARSRYAGDRLAEGKGLVDLDWLTDMYQRDRYDEFWQSRSFVARASEISIPTLHGGVWYDHFIRGTLTSHAAIDAPKRLFVGPGNLATRIDGGEGGFGAVSVAWFERFLCDVDNGVERGPAARFYLMGAEEYVDVDEWPIPTTDTELFLHGTTLGGTLSSDRPAGDEVPDAIVHDPGAPNITPIDVFDQRDFEAGCLTFTSEPLGEESIVIGSPRLVLYASTDAPDVDWCIRLCDVDETGRSKLLNTGALKGSHVESHERPSPLVAGRVYRFDIEIWAIANLFRVGHRIRVDVSTSDFPFFEVNPHPSHNLVFHDRERPSRLVLPIQ